MFEPNEVALDIFGDEDTSDARRRCQPTEATESGPALINLHMSAAVLYAAAYFGWKHTPWCAELLTTQMIEVGCPLSLVTEDEAEPSTDTPWGLAKAYIDETVSFLTEFDGWNADGGMGGKEFNRVPFTGDFCYEDSAGNE